MGVLRWTFRKGHKSLTCLLHRSGTASSFDVYVIPHWDIASSIGERADTALHAFCRHAEVASRLRAAGWRVIERSR